MEKILRQERGAESRKEGTRGEERRAERRGLGERREERIRGEEGRADKRGKGGNYEGGGEEDSGQEGRGEQRGGELDRGEDIPFGGHPAGSGGQTPGR